jgi:hypothetical protein
MYHQNCIVYATVVLALSVGVGCGSHKKPVQQHQAEHRHETHETYIMHQIRARVEGVECASCVQDVLTQLKKVPGVSMAVFVGNYDACELGYFSFYFPATETFDVDAFNAQLAADDFVMKLITQ